MKRGFHGALNRMAFFTAFVAVLVIMFFPLFMQIATSNIWLNGIILGTSIFGIGLCFVEIFKLLPEYRWLTAYINRKPTKPLPPYLLRPVALMLSARPKQISSATLNDMLELILIRIEDSRESIRYVTNTLIFLGLLGTFWGLILTVGGFAELIGNLNFSDETVMESMQAGLVKPLTGMATAFTSSLMGLAGSLLVGFLGLQVQIAQNTIFNTVQEFLATRTRTSTPSPDEIVEILPQINLATHELTRSVKKLSKSVSDLT
jgi:hypothetical protein